jgi:hypothetical protein
MSTSKRRQHASPIYGACNARRRARQQAWRTFAKAYLRRTTLQWIEEIPESTWSPGYKEAAIQRALTR